MQFMQLDTPPVFFCIHCFCLGTCHLPRIYWLKESTCHSCKGLTGALKQRHQNTSLSASRKMEAVQVCNCLLPTHSQNICTEFIAPTSETLVRIFSRCLSVILQSIQGVTEMLFFWSSQYIDETVVSPQKHCSHLAFFP